MLPPVDLAHPCNARRQAVSLIVIAWLQQLFWGCSARRAPPFCPLRSSDPQRWGWGQLVFFTFLVVCFPLQKEEACVLAGLLTR